MRDDTRVRMEYCTCTKARGALRALRHACEANARRVPAVLLPERAPPRIVYREKKSRLPFQKARFLHIRLFQPLSQIKLQLCPYLLQPGGFSGAALGHVSPAAALAAQSSIYRLNDFAHIQVYPFAHENVAYLLSVGAQQQGKCLCFQRALAQGPSGPPAHRTAA